MFGMSYVEHFLTLRGLRVFFASGLVRCVQPGPRRLLDVESSSFIENCIWHRDRTNLNAVPLGTTAKFMHIELHLTR